MLFFKFNAYWISPVKTGEWQEEREYHEEIHSATDEFNRKNKDAVCFS